jgi:hypothetical protein
VRQVPVCAGLVVGLVAGEYTGGREIGQADEVHASGGVSPSLARFGPQAIICVAYRSMWDECSSRSARETG